MNFNASSITLFSNLERNTSAVLRPALAAWRSLDLNSSIPILVASTYHIQKIINDFVGKFGAINEQTNKQTNKQKMWSAKIKEVCNSPHRIGTAWLLDAQVPSMATVVRLLAQRVP
jgi:hypothetical protein